MDIIERAARALSVPEHHTTWDILTPMQKDLYYMQARAVLSALREPDEGMIDVGLKAYLGWRDGNDWSTANLANGVWQAMIDQALKG